MEPGLRLTAETYETGFSDLRVRVESERFAGSTCVATEPGVLEEFAASLRGFPAEAGDDRVFEFGDSSSEPDDGYCRLSFRSTGGLGAAILEVHIEDDSWMYPSANAQLYVSVEAASVDRFVEQLGAIIRDGDGTAFLPSG